MSETPEPPGDVVRLLEQRRLAREAKDFALADRLRKEIEALGWAVLDSPQGSRLESLAGHAETYATVAAVPSRADAPDTCDHSLCLAVHGWPEDVRRLLSACPDVGEVVAVDVAGTGVAPSDLAPPSGALALSRVHVVRVEEPIGQAEAWNIAARRAGGRVILFVEPSLEFGTSVLSCLADALDDVAAGLVGPFGLSTGDMRTFEPATGPGVDALEYLLAMRRADLARTGEFDRRFRFYRNLDIDFSYQVRAAGLKVRQVDCGAVTRHRHRLWESTPEAERDRLSRKNFNRFLDRWGRS